MTTSPFAFCFQRSGLRGNNLTMMKENFGPPGNYDVICSKRKDDFKHVGNRRFRLTVENLLPAYLDAQRKAQKTRVVRKVVDIVHTSGGRFLRRVNDGKDNNRYELLKKRQITVKVSEAIRWHHAPTLADSEKEAVGIAHVANALAHKFEIGSSGTTERKKIRIERK